MFNPLTIHSSLTAYSGCDISYSTPDEDAPPIFTFGNAKGSLQLCIHDEALRLLVELSEKALGEMDTSQIEELADMASPSELGGSPVVADSSSDRPSSSDGSDNHGMKLVSWMCVEDDLDIDFVVQSPDHMFFRVGLGKDNTFEFGLEVMALARFAKLAAEALTVLDSLSSADETTDDEAAA